MTQFPAVGQVVGGFRLESVLGRGGMGAVFRATDTRLGRPVAIKVIAPDLAGDPVYRARFQREAKAAAALEHPNVVPVYAADDEDGLLYIATRLINGPDAGALVAEHGPLAPGAAVRIVAQVADALDAAHRIGLIHRDVKPANILVDGDTAYLTDFGIAKDLDGTGVTQTGIAIGTLGYAAPEQLAGEPVDARTDVYALGAVLAHLLTAQPPRAHLGHGLRATGNRAMDDVLATATATTRGRRFASAGELATAAQRALSQDSDDAVTSRMSRSATASRTRVAPVILSAEGPAPPASEPRRRRRAMIAAVLAAVAATGLAAALVAAGGGRGSDQTLPATTTVVQTTERTVTTPSAAPVAAAKPTQSATAAPAPDVVQIASWPVSRSAWTVILRSVRTRGAAEATAVKAVGAGRGTPGVLWSSDFASLRSGYWVAYAGSFSTGASAQSAVAAYRSAGWPDAYVRQVSNATDGPATWTSFDTGRAPGETYVATVCDIGLDGGLTCWTPNDGYTIAVPPGGVPVRVRQAEAGHRGDQPDVPTLSLGRRWERDGYSCTSTAAALTCTSGAGHGFRLPRYRGLPTTF